MPTLCLDELTSFFRGLKEDASPELDNQMVDLAAETVDPLRWATPVERVGLEVAPRRTKALVVLAMASRGAPGKSAGRAVFRGGLAVRHPQSYMTGVRRGSA